MDDLADERLDLASPTLRFLVDGLRLMVSECQPASDDYELHGMVGAVERVRTALRQATTLERRGSCYAWKWWGLASERGCSWRNGADALRDVDDLWSDLDARVWADWLIRATSGSLSSGGNVYLPGSVADLLPPPARATDALNGGAEMDRWTQAVAKRVLGEVHRELAQAHDELAEHLESLAEQEDGAADALDQAAADEEELANAASGPEAAKLQALARARRARAELLRRGAELHRACAVRHRRSALRLRSQLRPSALAARLVVDHTPPGRLVAASPCWPQGPPARMTAPRSAAVLALAA